eukprot:Amastigsp_a843042_51.p6 type:complete len:123 gc:universal Amastigsp_a843042_51:1741-1373(-)
MSRSSGARAVSTTFASRRTFARSETTQGNTDNVSGPSRATTQGERGRRPSSRGPATTPQSLRAFVIRRGTTAASIPRSISRSDLDSARGTATGTPTRSGSVPRRTRATARKPSPWRSRTSIQ